MKPIRVGTDCSGIEAPIVALQNLQIPFQHVFSSEIDKYARISIEANYHPKILFEDMTKRNIKDVPDIDLYVCGFPCQPFSKAGKREGIDDPRGTIFWHCLHVIQKKRPNVFILENVRGLLSIHQGETFKEIICSLEEITRYRKPVYDVYWKVLNTRDYGIPQNRTRVFIVGIKKSVGKRFEWPEKAEMRDIKEYVDWTDTAKKVIPAGLSSSGLLDRIPKSAIFINSGFRAKHETLPKSHMYCSCLTATCYNFWCVLLSRQTNIKELLQLQGFPINFKQSVSRTQLARQIGNSMSVNVVEALLKRIYF